MPSQIQSMRQHCFLGTFQSPQNHRQVPWVNHWPGDQNKLTRTIYKARDQRMLTSRQYTELEGAGSNSHQIDLDCGKSSVLNNQILQKRQNGTKQTLESENIPKHSLFKFIKRLLPATTGPGPVGAAKAALAAADIPPPANAWQANAELSKSACDHSPSLWIECEEETAVVCRKFMWRYLKLAPQLPLTHQPLWTLSKPVRLELVVTTFLDRTEPETTTLVQGPQRTQAWPAPSASGDVLWVVTPGIQVIHGYSKLELCHIKMTLTVLSSWKSARQVVKLMIYSSGRRTVKLTEFKVKPRKTMSCVGR